MLIRLNSLGAHRIQDIRRAVGLAEPGFGAGLRRQAGAAVAALQQLGAAG